LYFAEQLRVGALLIQQLDDNIDHHWLLDTHVFFDFLGDPRLADFLN